VRNEPTVEAVGNKTGKKRNVQELISLTRTAISATVSCINLKFSLHE
jgi:hypothetical protein